MMTRTTAPRLRTNRSRGAALIEFALVLIQLCIVLLASIEFGRMVLLKTSLANAARAGARYAIVHGSKNGSGYVNGPCASPSTPCSPAGIQAAVEYFAKAGILVDITKLTTAVTYPDGNLNSPGSRVRVTVTYPYDAFVGLVPVSLITMQSTSEGVITF